MLSMNWSILATYQYVPIPFLSMFSNQCEMRVKGQRGVNPSATIAALQEDNNRLRQRVAELEQALASQQPQDADPNSTGTDRQHRHAGQDSIDYKQMEEELRTFKLLADRAPDGIALVNMEGTIIYANAAYNRILGHEDAVGLTHADVTPPDGAHRIAEVGEHVAQYGTWQGIYPYRRKDGSIFPAQLSVFSLDDAGSSSVYGAAIMRDISEQQRMEEERAKLQQQVIDAQRAALRELSTPLIPIADNTVVMPLIGAIDGTRAQLIMEILLEGIAQHQAEIAILDITGVQVVDTQVADALIRVAQAVKLLGTQVVLTGIQPQIAQTLVHLGIDLRGMTTHSTLQAGIAYALGQ